MGAASKLFWKTLKGPEVKPVELYFGILNVDSKSSNFQKMLKKKVVSSIIVLIVIVQCYCVYYYVYRMLLLVCD